MACRHDDLEKMRADLLVLVDAYGKVTRMLQLDAQITEYLEAVSSVIDETLLVPQNGLPGSIKGANTKANAALTALSAAMFEAQEKLCEDIEAAQAEDDAFHG